MILVNVYELDAETSFSALRFLYNLFGQRPLEHGISHRRMPSFSEHLQFVQGRPFRYWYLIEEPNAFDWSWIGAIEVLPSNEFGIHLRKGMQDQGFGRKAVELFLSTHEPLPAIPAVRNGHWLANVAPANEGAIAFFQALGFHKIQETFQLD